MPWKPARNLRGPAPRRKILPAPGHRHCPAAQWDHREGAPRPRNREAPDGFKLTARLAIGAPPLALRPRKPMLGRRRAGGGGILLVPEPFPSSTGRAPPPLHSRPARCGRTVGPGHEERALVAQNASESGSPLAASPGGTPRRCSSSPATSGPSTRCLTGSTGSSPADRERRPAAPRAQPGLLGRGSGQGDRGRAGQGRDRGHRRQLHPPVGRQPPALRPAET